MNEVDYFYMFYAYIACLCYCSLGNVYIADWFNHRIRKATVSTGIITTIVGTGTVGYSGDNGAASSAQLGTPTGVALDTSGNCEYCCLLFAYLLCLILVIIAL